MFEDGLVIKQKTDKTNADGGIRQVEDSAKEGLTANPRQLFGPSEEREVEHIHYPTRQETAISLAPRGERGGFTKRQTLGVDETVASVVDEIAHSTGNDEGEADEDAPRQLGMDDAAQDNGEIGYRHDPKDGEEGGCHELHAECHAGVFGEENVEPRCDLHRFKERKVGFYHILHHLVCYHNEESNRPSGEAAHDERILECHE